MTKAIPGTCALTMILVSPICYTLKAPRISTLLAIAGWAVLIVLAAKMEEE